MAHEGHTSYSADFGPMFNRAEESLGWDRRLRTCLQGPIQKAWKGPRWRGLVSLIDAFVDFPDARMPAKNRAVDFLRDLCWRSIL